MQPVAAVPHTEVTHHTLDAAVRCAHQNRVAAAGASGPVGRNAVGIDIFARFHVGDRIADVFGLPSRHHPPLPGSVAFPPTAVVKTKAGVTSLTEAFEHQDVMLGILEAQKARSLNDSGPGFALISVREVDGPVYLVAFAVKANVLCPHSYPLGPQGRQDFLA